MNNHYVWGHERRYNDFPSYFKKLFSSRIQKLSVNAGFTCPNRDGSKSVGGCTYCNNKSFNPDYSDSRKSISEQIKHGINFFKHKYKTQKYLAYFQAYSNTYGSLDRLKKVYEEALSHQKIIGLVIGTRPDCVSHDVLDYLEELAKEHYIAVEYGVESGNNKALTAINRGHSYADAEKWIFETAGRGIHIGVHLINGLPHDTKKSMMNHAIKISKLPIDSLKLHQLQIVKHTQMEKDYEENPDQFHLFGLHEYLNFVADVLERINPLVMLERFVNQTPPNWLIAPKWKLKNYEFIHKLDCLLEERNTWQGRLFEG